MLTPKSLLRHAQHGLDAARSWPRAASSRSSTTTAITQPAKVRRLVLCSGKVYVDLADQRGAQGQPEGGHLTRVEQLYPFPRDQIRAVLDALSRSCARSCWVQEEPENMGAWEFVRPLLEQLIDGRWPLRYIGRARNSSPSEGSSAWHAANQRAIVEQVFEADQAVDPHDGTANAACLLRSRYSEPSVI